MLQQKTISLLLLTIQSVALCYHIIIITGMLPYDAVWGGRLKSRDEMLQFEVVSVGISLFIIWVLLQGAGYIQNRLSQKTFRVLCYVLSGVFLLNTFGNLAALNIYEKWIGAALTASSSLLFFILARRLL